MQPQRLTVPLFQRPYVWNEENQWEPLWSDIVRMTERLLAAPNAKHHPHFLGAVVLQQVSNSAGTMQERTIIDGQQRLPGVLERIRVGFLGAGNQRGAYALPSLSDLS